MRFKTDVDPHVILVVRSESGRNRGTAPEPPSRRARCLVNLSVIYCLFERLGLELKLPNDQNVGAETKSHASELAT